VSFARQLPLAALDFLIVPLLFLSVLVVAITLSLSWWSSNALVKALDRIRK